MSNGWTHWVDFNQSGPCFGMVSELRVEDKPVMRCGQFWSETPEDYYNRLIREGGDYLKKKTLLK